MLGALLGAARTAARIIFPNQEQKTERMQLEHSLQAALMEQSAQIQASASAVVRAEAMGHSWLQRNWRPIVMLVFTGLIVARWLGWSTPDLGEAEALKLWDIVKLGLGGYVLGRSVEKIVPMVRNGGK